jgi:hypothetical protein
VKRRRRGRAAAAPREGSGPGEPPIADGRRYHCIFTRWRTEKFKFLSFPNSGYSLHSGIVDKICMVPNHECHGPVIVRLEKNKAAQYNSQRALAVGL